MQPQIQQPLDCDPDCTKGKRRQKRHEYVGPVKIVFLEPDPAQYRLDKCGSAFIGLAYLLIGYTVLSIVLYTFRFDLDLYMNLHVGLCTIGYQLFLPMSILTYCPVNGPSVKLTKCDKGSDHILIGLFGAICAVCGSVLVFLMPQYSIITVKKSPHCALGFIAFIFLLATCASGPASFWSKRRFIKYIRKAHIIFGCITFVLSTVCFVLGLIKPSFIIWFKPLENMLYFHIVFCTFYTFVIIVRPLRSLNKEPVTLN